jgi:glyoxylase-like metal-dependent hydrolase (beta-lactamase superfamily II)
LRWGHGNSEVEVHSVPGHTDGHLALYDGGTGTWFVSDAVLGELGPATLHEVLPGRGSRGGDTGGVGAVLGYSTRRDRSRDPWSIQCVVTTRAARIRRRGHGQGITRM